MARNLLTHLKINHKILLLIFLVSFFSTIAYTVRSYRVERQTIMDGLDAKLLVAANSVAHIVPRGWHDRVKDARSISSEEYNRCVKEITDAANEYHVRYIYAMMMFGGKIVFTCSSTTYQELKAGTNDKYFQVYDTASPELYQAFRDGQIHYSEYTDQWGHFRSVFIPRLSPGGKRYVVAADIPIHFIQQRLTRTLLDSLLIGVTVFAVVFLFGWLLVNMISGPIRRLSDYTRELVSNNFQAPPAVEAGLQQIATTYHDEVGNLAESFIFMEHELQEYIVRIKEATAARERIESELRVGRQIQMSVLPRKFPPFPGRKEFEIHAHIEPAKEMSGDFFDFYLIKRNLLYFTIADVSGKGVPASLLMVTTRTLLEAMANAGVTGPHEILEKVNTEISRKNDALLFVTVFYGILDVTSGEVHYANAGHNPPYLLRAGGELEALRPAGEADPAVGIDEEFPYQAGSLQLQPGDCFFLYTDGVTEAMDVQREQFSEVRLEALLRREGGLPVTELVGRVVTEVKAFAGGAPQSDDITVLAIRYRGQPG